jgi:hypothetical protein
MVVFFQLLPASASDVLLLVVDVILVAMPADGVQVGITN